MNTAKHLRRSLLLLIVVAFSVPAFAQERISAVRTGVKASDAIIFEQGIDSIRLPRRVAPRRANTFDDDNEDYDYTSFWNYEYYKYAYPSINAKGETVLLTALAAMPYKGTNPINNVVLGCHVTITDNGSTPSSYVGGGSKFSDVGMLVGHARRSDGKKPAYNCLVILPDYQGYGVTKDQAHPYLAQEITARQSVDALRYGLELYEQSKKQRPDLRPEWKTVCIGYSQGGSVAMASHRFMETNFLAEDLHLGGSVCGDGPYDPIATMRVYMLEDKVYMPVAVPLIIKGMLDYNPYMRKHRPEDYFTDKFIGTGIFGWIDGKQISVSDIQKKLKNTYTFLKDSRGEYIRMSDIFRPAAFAYMQQKMRGEEPESNPKFEDLYTALTINDLTQAWQPRHPIYLFHSKDDEVVPYANAESALSRLNTTSNPSMVKLGTVTGKTHVDNGQTFYISLNPFKTCYEEQGMTAIVGGEDAWNNFNP